MQAMFVQGSLHDLKIGVHIWDSEITLYNLKIPMCMICISMCAEILRNVIINSRTLILMHMYSTSGASWSWIAIITIMYDILMYYASISSIHVQFYRTKLEMPHIHITVQCYILSSYLYR